MDIAALIDRVGAIRRRFAGGSYTSRLPLPCTGFMGEVELLRSDDGICFEGGLIAADGSVPTHFKFYIPFAGLSPTGGQAVLTSQLCGSMTGTMLSTPHGFEFLGRSSTCSSGLHLEFLDRTEFKVSGMLEFETHHIAFSAEPATQWERTSQAKVVALHARAKRDA